MADPISIRHLYSTLKEDRLYFFLKNLGILWLQITSKKKAKMSNKIGRSRWTSKFSFILWVISRYKAQMSKRLVISMGSFLPAEKRIFFAFLTAKDV